jgi:hypothetical protein
MNYPAANSGVSKRTETFGTSSGGELGPSRRRRDYPSQRMVVLRDSENGPNPGMMEPVNGE